MGMIFVALVYLPRILLMLIGGIIIAFYPIFLATGIFFLCKWVIQLKKKHAYYDYCKRHKLSPADDDNNFMQFTKSDIKDTRDL